MHDFDTLAADPGRLAAIEAAARAVCRDSASSQGGDTVDETAVRHLADLLSGASGVAHTRDGERLAGLVRRFGVLQKAVYDRGRGPVAPTFDEHDRATEARRGDWLLVRREAYTSFSNYVRGGLAPPTSGSVVVRGTERASGDAVTVYASTVDALRRQLAARGVTHVEINGWVAVDSHGASWTDTYALADLPENVLDQVRKAEGEPACGLEFVFDIRG